MQIFFSLRILSSTVLCTVNHSVVHFGRVEMKKNVRAPHIPINLQKMSA